MLRPHQAPLFFLLFYVCVPYWPLWDLPEELPPEPVSCIFHSGFPKWVLYEENTVALKTNNLKADSFSWAPPWTAPLPETPSPPPPSASLAASLSSVLHQCFPPNSQSPKPCAWPFLHFLRALMEHLGAPFLACYYENLFISVSVIICWSERLVLGQIALMYVGFPISRRPVQRMDQRPSLAVQCLRLRASSAGGVGSIFSPCSGNWDPTCFSVWPKKKKWPGIFFPFLQWTLLFFFFFF